MTLDAAVALPTTKQPIALKRQGFPEPEGSRCMVFDHSKIQDKLFYAERQLSDHFKSQVFNYIKRRFS